MGWGDGGPGDCKQSKLKIDTLNLKTDGEIRYVNGGYTLVPWMESTDDDLYKGCLEDLLKLGLFQGSYISW